MPIKPNKHEKIIQLAPTLTLGVILFSIGCKSSGSKSDGAVTALVSRSDKLLALGNESEAYETLRFVLAYDSTNPAAKDKLSKIKGGGNWMSTAEEVSLMRELINKLIGSTTSEELCKFSMSSAVITTTNLQMLADTILLPKLLSGSFNFSSGPCPGQSISMYLGKPGRSLTYVKTTYGSPTAEVLNDGQGYADYGRFRLIIAKDGGVTGIAFPPLK